MIELKIDPEFRDLIPPLTGEEYQALEKSLIENGFNPAFRIIVWKDQNIVIDGHNRLGICQRNNIPYEIIEQEFASRYDAMAWIIDNQLARRNINAITRNDLIGRRYSVEKSRWGTNQHTIRTPQNEESSKWTTHRIAEQVGVGHATVERAEKLSKAIDIITANTGISRADILSGRIRATQDDIKAFAELDAESQKKIMAKAIAEKDDLSTATKRYNAEEMDRRIKEAEEQKKQMEEKLRLEREEKEKQERERLKAEREEKEREEKERLAKVREEQERIRLENVEYERKIALEKAKDALEQERIKKEKEEQIRLEKEQIKKEKEEQERIEKERFEKLRIEQERKDEEELKRLKLEQERIDAERIAEAAKIEIVVTPYDPYLKCACNVMGKIDFDAWISKDREYRLNANRFDHSNPEMFGKVWFDILDAGRDTAKLTEKLIENYMNECIEEAFIIVKNETDTVWFMNLMYTASAVVFPVSAPKSQLKSHALVYFGKSVERFMKECDQFGWGVILNR